MHCHLQTNSQIWNFFVILFNLLLILVAVNYAIYLKEGRLFSELQFFSECQVVEFLEKIIFIFYRMYLKNIN